MKIYKLLILLLAFTGLHSCTEYLDNGMSDNGYEQPEIPDFIAGLAEEKEINVRDTVVFEAKLNNVDVTSTTTFKVNGVELKRDYNPKNGYTYIAVAEGEHTVVATLDNFSYSFTFEVLEDEPEPTGNRIEYDGESYPVSNTAWELILDEENLYEIPINNVMHAVWYISSSEFDSSDDVLHQFVTLVAMPVNSQGQAVLPYADSSQLVHLGGYLVINGAPVFEESSDVVYTFAGSGNNPPNSQNLGTANYTGLMTDDASSDTAELFWNGDYLFSTPDITDFSKAKSPKNTIDIKKVRSVKGLNLNKVNNSNLLAK